MPFAVYTLTRTFAKQVYRFSLLDELQRVLWAPVMNSFTTRIGS